MRATVVTVLTVFCAIACGRRDEARGRYGPETPAGGVATVLAPPSAWGGGPTAIPSPSVAPIAPSSSASACPMPTSAAPSKPQSVMPPRSVVPPLVDPAKRPRG